MMDIQIELFESMSEGIYVTHSRVKQRMSKLFPISFWSLGVTIVAVLILLNNTLETIKEKLGKFTGRLLWTRNAKSFLKQPTGRNVVSKVPSDIAERHLRWIYFLFLNAVSSNCSS